MLNKVAFMMYPVRDVARARQFYEDTLGLKVGLTGSHGDKWWIEYDLPGGGCLALTNFTGEPSTSAGGTIAFEVEDFDALITHPQVRRRQAPRRCGAWPQVPDDHLPRQRRQREHPASAQC
jgi:catechol 2,3-dioxygenase-like lactoylglutathione lyase family enzyme